MTCPRHDELSAYADQAMKPGERSLFEQHLQNCAICRRQFEDLQALRRSLRALPSPALGFDLAARLKGRLDNRPQRPPRRRPWPALWGGHGWMSTGLAAGVALVAGVWLGGLLLGGAGTAVATRVSMVRVFDPVPPGGLCAAAELCRLSKGNR